MHRILRALTSELDHDTRATILTRVDNLMRGVRYEAARNTQVYRDAKNARWTVDRVEVICCLNAFYQVVLGPLAAATRSDLQVGLVRDIPIQYGDKIRVTNTDAASIRQCHAQFMMMTQQLRIDFWCLQSAHSKDLLYRLAHPNTNHE
jgi:hypothetical protein